MEKVKVYTIEMHGSKLFAQSLEDLLEALKYELENIEDNDTWEFNFSTIYMTQKEIDSVGEFDGF